MGDPQAPEDIEVLDFHFDTQMQSKRTSYPVIVKKVDLVSAKVDVQPAHKFKIVETREIRTPALIQDVPIIFQRSGSSLDLLPISVGDIGQVIVSDRSISEWLSGKGTPVYPKNRNIMEGSQASFLPGGYPFSMKFIDTLPENARSIIVNPNTGLFLGDPKEELTENGGVSDIINMMVALTTIVLAHDPTAGGGANISKLNELLAALAKLKVSTWD
jgi:hypothetical protein